MCVSLRAGLQGVHQKLRPLPATTGRTGAGCMPPGSVTRTVGLGYGRPNDARNPRRQGRECRPKACGQQLRLSDRASNGRLGKTSPGEEAGDITEKRSRLLVLQNLPSAFGRVSARPRCCGLAGPAKVREHGHLVQGDRNFRNEGGDGLEHLSVVLWGRIPRHWQGQVVPP